MTLISCQWSSRHLGALWVRERAKALPAHTAQLTGPIADSVAYPLLPSAHIALSGASNFHKRLAIVASCPLITSHCTQDAP